MTNYRKYTTEMLTTKFGQNPGFLMKIRYFWLQSEVFLDTIRVFLAKNGYFWPAKIRVFCLCTVWLSLIMDSESISSALMTLLG